MLEIHPQSKNKVTCITVPYGHTAIGMGTCTAL
jgi:hypothetical protein